jgi:hypothetical protein
MCECRVFESHWEERFLDGMRAELRNGPRQPKTCVCSVDKHAVKCIRATDRTQSDFGKTLDDVHFCGAEQHVTRKSGFKIQTRPAPTAQHEDKNLRARRQRYLRFDVFLLMAR